MIPTDDHSSPATEPQEPADPGALESDFFGKLMKGGFKRHIDGYGPGIAIQSELRDIVVPGAYVSTPSFPLLPTFKPPE